MFYWAWKLPASGDHELLLCIKVTTLSFNDLVDLRISWLKQVRSLCLWLILKLGFVSLAFRRRICWLSVTNHDIKWPQVCKVPWWLSGNLWLATVALRLMQRNPLSASCAPLTPSPLVWSHPPHGPLSRFTHQGVTFDWQVEGGLRLAKTREWLWVFWVQTANGMFWAQLAEQQLCSSDREFPCVSVCMTQTLYCIQGLHEKSLKMRLVGFSKVRAVFLTCCCLFASKCFQGLLWFFPSSGQES